MGNINQLHSNIDKPLFIQELAKNHDIQGLRREKQALMHIVEKDIYALDHKLIPNLAEELVDTERKIKEAEELIDYINGLIFSLMEEETIH